MSVELSPQEPAGALRRPPPEGAVVLGGDYRALGVVRSLGRRGVPVWVIREGEDALAARSKYAQRRLSWVRGSELAQVERLVAIADEGAAGWALIPSADETAALVARHHRVLEEHFALTTPPWIITRFAYDKRCTYPHAASVGVDVPRTEYPKSRAELEALALDYPVVLKPATKAVLNRLTAAKAWRVDDRDALLVRYDEACALVPPEILMVQELVPGGGEAQFSYAALCADGEILASLVARRTRQYPPDFGRASTYVETVERPEIIAPSERLLDALRWTGLVEVEFKRDPRDGRFKLLDVNPRVWGWHTLCGRAGVDFPYLLWLALRGEAVPCVYPQTGVRWVRTTTDLPMAAKEILSGRMSARAYARSLRGPLEGAIFARDDPAPALSEMPQLASILMKRIASGSFV